MLDFESKPVKDQSLDLSQHSIIQVPDTFLIKINSIQYLYLEGNELKELSKDFFPILKKLKWLDVRNNKLTTIPSSIAGHPSLQVLLLEKNKIEKLPKEIGSVNSLRGLQLAHNPTIYPPVDVVNLGVKATIDFLQRQWQQLQSPQHIQLISETLSPKGKPCKTKQQKVKLSRSAGHLNVSGHKTRRPANQMSANTLSLCIRVRPLSQQLRANHLSSHQSLELKTLSPLAYSRKPSFALRDFKNLPSQQKSLKKINDEVQPKLIRDIWIEKIRQVLLTQDAILQQRRSADVLKQWQDDTKLLQLTHSKRGVQADVNYPYDTDNDYMKMLTRSELASGGQTGKELSALHTRHEEPVNTKILTMMTALQELQAEQSSVVATPRTEQKVLAQEIKKIKEIQRCLSALKLKNFGHLNISS